jgi:hypothetical protein
MFGCLGGTNDFIIIIDKFLGGHVGSSGSLLRLVVVVMVYVRHTLLLLMLMGITLLSWVH